jgi:predicted phage terminase large subunit-like protein
MTEAADPRALLGTIDAELSARLDLLAVHKFSWFVRRMWPVLNPGSELVWGPHLDVICEAVEKQLRGYVEYRNLIIMIPPGFMKSMLVSVMRPAFMWLHFPHRQSLYTSNTKPLASRDSRKTRDVISSPEYKRLLTLVTSEGHATAPCEICGKHPRHKLWDFADDQNEKENFATTEHGFREIIVMDGTKTGRRGDDLVVDDPLDADKVRKADGEALRTMLEDAAGTVKYIFGTRFNNPRTVTRTMVMQRFDPNDPAGVLLREGTWPWRVICLPQEYQPDHEYVCATDWRTVPGELLCPAFFGAADVKMAKAALGLTAYMAQHQQTPTNEESALIKRAWLGNRYTDLPVDMAHKCDEVAISVDCTFKGGEQNDRVAIQVWARQGQSRFYLLDVRTEHLGFLATVEAIRSMRERWPQARLVLVEDKANGPAVMEVLRREFSGVVSFNPNGSSKPERVKVGVVPALESQSVWLPANVGWVDEYVEELVAFTGKPGGRDDNVDATSQILLRWTAGGGSNVGVPEVMVSRVAPILSTSVVTRWAPVDRSDTYTVGVGADWSTSAQSAGMAVVVDRSRGWWGSREARKRSRDWWGMRRSTGTMPWSWSAGSGRRWCRARSSRWPGWG